MKLELVITKISSVSSAGQRYISGRSLCGVLDTLHFILKYPDPPSDLQQNFDLEVKP